MKDYLNNVIILVIHRNRHQDHVGMWDSPVQGYLGGGLFLLFQLRRAYWDLDI